MSALNEDIGLAANGDKGAYSRVIRNTQNLVSSPALATVNDVAASEDIAQEVFLQVWAGLRKLRSADSFLPWLRQLTRNRATEFLRLRYRVAKVGELTGDESLSNAVDERPSAQKALPYLPQELVALKRLRNIQLVVTGTYSGLVVLAVLLNQPILILIGGYVFVPAFFITVVRGLSPLRHAMQARALCG